MAPGFVTPVSGARLPRRTAIPPRFEKGDSSVFITSLFFGKGKRKAFTFSSTVRPVQVKASFSMIGSMFFSIRGMPPAIQKSSVFHFDAGLIRTICGVSCSRREKSSITSTPASASAAMAARCITALVEPLMASVARTPFTMEEAFSIFRAVNPSRAISQIRSPVAQASRSRSAWTAGTSALPGSVIPRTSARQHIVFAVPKKEQEPQVGAQRFSSE